MATEIVQQWIQSEVKLSKIISSFEADFSNGLLFGELLHQYDLIQDLSGFSKKNNKESKVKNFQQVEQVLRDLKIKFDAKLIHQIMNEERGAALRLLYQIKLAIAKTTGDYGDMKTTTNLKFDTVNKKIEQTYQLKQTLPVTSKLQTMNRSKKLEPIEKKLLPFEHKKKLQQDKAYQDQKREEELIMKLYQDQRHDNFRKMEENKQFMHDWEHEGKQKWKKNQQKRQETINRQKYFEDKEVEVFKKKLMKELDEATNELNGGIDEFERNLQKLGIEKNTNIEDAIKRMEEKKGVPPGQIQNFSYAATMNKIKEKKNVSEFAAKERDRRRRKMVVDQSKTQTDLDRKKNEEQMIQKLLKKQAEEQKFAYLEQRNLQCKELVFRNRQEKALQLDDQRKIQKQQDEKRRSEEQQSKSQEYKYQIQENRKMYQQIRREERLKKKQIDKEICSEVMDLILDVANEAFDEQQKGKKKLDKPMWRDWMKHFKDGQLVSRARKGAQIQETFLVEDHNDMDYDPVNDYIKKIEDVLDEMKYDQSYADLLEYLSVVGMFNISNSNFGEWTDIQNLSQLEGIQIDFQFLDSLIPSSNPELGRTLQSLLLNLWKEDKTDVVETVQEAGIPHHLTLKLCLLGKACAGKRTIAKQIQDQFNGKIKVFKMEEMIKEVLDYVNPKPVAEAVPDLKKKAPAPKGKEEPIFVDQYAGQDTKEYKEIGTQIKKFIGEGEIPQGKELISLIPDDNLLVKLFIQKLKLTFSADKSEATKIEEIKQNILREKELLEQLAELENQAQVEPKGKAPAKAPAKKGGVSNEEQLRQDLEAIQKIQPEGWILLDFPRTLAQAKIMEKLMNGYTCSVDESKSVEQRKFEQWSKLVTPFSTISTESDSAQEYFNGEPFIYGSAMDGFVFIDVPSEECLRRIQNRKIDPQTGSIYHLEDNPPPEGDIKLKDRLQDYTDPETADVSRINHNHMVYEDNEKSLKKWVSGFGLNDPQLTAQTPVNLLLEVEVPHKQRKDEVYDKVQSQISQIIAFKQAQFDFKKQQVRDQIINQQFQSQDTQQQEQQQLEQEQDNNQEEQIAHETYPQPEEFKNRNQAVSQVGSQQSRRSKLSERMPPQPLTEDQKRDIWAAFESSYYRDCLQVFKLIRRQRDLVLEGLNQMQLNFLDFLQRSDNKQQLVNDFIESFNRFSQEFPDLRQDQQTINELLNRVNKLSNDLWNIVEVKKDEAIAQHAKLVSEGWVVHEMRKLIKNSTKVIQSELQKFFTVYKILLATDDCQEINVEKIFDNFVDDGIIVIESDSSSPLLDKIYSYILKVIQYQQESFKQLDEKTRSTLLIEIQNLLFRLNLIRTWIVLKLKEYNRLSKRVYYTLDDWIVDAVQAENEQCSKIIEKLREFIYEKVTQLDYSQLKLGYLDLTNQIQKIDFNEYQVPEYLQHVQNSREINDSRLKVQMLEHFYRDFRYYSFEEYLDGQTFVHMIVLAFQENRVPANWRQYNFNVFNQIVKRMKAIPDGQESETNQLYSHRDEDKEQTEREFVDWKKVLTMFILSHTRFDSYSDDISNYQAKLEANVVNEKQEIDLETFVKIPAWFDNQESIPEKKTERNPDDDYGDEDQAAFARDFERLNSIKSLLFKTHQKNTRMIKVTDITTCLNNVRNLLRNSGCSTPQEYLFGSQ